MGISKIYVNNNLKIDLTKTTATAEDVAAGKEFYNKQGDLVQGSFTVAPSDQKFKAFLEDSSSDICEVSVPANTAVQRPKIFNKDHCSHYNIQMGLGASIVDGCDVFYGYNSVTYAFDFATEADMYNFFRSGADACDADINSYCTITGLKLNGQEVTELKFPEGSNYCRAGLSPASVTYVEFPADGFNIGEYFMSESYCSVIVRCKSDYPPSVYYNSFWIGDGANIICKVIVPNGCKDNYIYAENWCNVADRIYEESEVTE